MLADNGGQPGHIFNLGHGVHPTSDPGVLAAIVEHVHEADAVRDDQHRYERRGANPACVAGERRYRSGQQRPAWPGNAMNGVVVMAYGTPRAREEILPYYTDIRRGRPPSDEQLAELTRRYEAIGGLSPLAERTEAQRVDSRPALDTIAPGEFVVAVGLRHVDPSIETAVDALADAGVDSIVGLVLAPHYSSMSVGVYLDRAAAAAERHELRFAGIERWADEPVYLDYLARDVSHGAQRSPRTDRCRCSRPIRCRSGSSAPATRYPDEVATTAALVAGQAGLPADRWSVAWQSAGRTDEPWLEPDLLSAIDSLAAAAEVDGVLVCPCGFVADHLEVLYDLDIEARQRAEAAGLVFRRTSVINDDRGVMDALARRIVDVARRS